MSPEGCLSSLCMGCRMAACLAVLVLGSGTWADDLDLDTEDITQGLTREYLDVVHKADPARLTDAERADHCSRLLFLLHEDEADGLTDEVLTQLARMRTPAASGRMRSEVEFHLDALRNTAFPIAERKTSARIAVRLAETLYGIGDEGDAGVYLDQIYGAEKGLNTWFAFDAMAEIGDESHRPVFERAVRSGNARVARRAARALFRITATGLFGPPVALEGEYVFAVSAPTTTWVATWTDFSALDIDMYWPGGGETNAQVMLHLVDWDHLWYQYLVPGYLQPGKTNRFRIDFSGELSRWKPRGHQANWHLRARAAPQEIAVHVFSEKGLATRPELTRTRGVPHRDRLPPRVRHVLANTNSVPCYEKFELTFDLPDRYRNPFDPEEVDVSAEITTPSGRRVSAIGFYARRCYRVVDEARERVLPRGSPYWCARYAPTEEGEHRYRIKVRDSAGTTTWGPGVFTATAARRPGFVRVSRRDPRYFEFDNDTMYFPIGHNIRSPNDLRMNQQFPWRRRWQEGAAAYHRYFEDMARNGENFVEIWASAWSLGLEWTPRQAGYHGLGQYNQLHAWQMDRVVEDADRRGIHINYVVHNHGKFSSFSDPEWALNPFNTVNGGYLSNPLAFFTDERAQRDFLNLMRYTIARWGYSPGIFAWQLWSELSLVGNRNADNTHNRSDVVAWHATMGRAIKALDPNDHMISTHYHGDYRVQSKAIIALPEMDLCPVDGYHGQADPLYIVELMRRTAVHNNPLNKPVLITEFGGSHVAQGLKHLEDTLHAAVWASMCVPLGGTPLFWWWGLIEEENLYPRYAALARYMQGEDLRDPKLKMFNARLTGPGAAGSGVRCLKSEDRAYGWVHATKEFSSRDPLAKPDIAGVQLGLSGMAPGPYRIEFWDTINGRLAATVEAQVTGGNLTAAVPAFARDVAFKVKQRPRR